MPSHGTAEADPSGAHTRRAPPVDPKHGDPDSDTKFGKAAGHVATEKAHRPEQRSSPDVVAPAPSRGSAFSRKYVYSLCLDRSANGWRVLTTQRRQLSQATPRLNKTTAAAAAAADHGRVPQKSDTC